MKFSFLFLASLVFSSSATQAQTTHTQTAPRNRSTLTPSSAAPALNPNSVNSRDLPPAGTPDAIDNTMKTSGKPMKSKKQKSTTSSGHGKTKTKM